MQPMRDPFHTGDDFESALEEVTELRAELHTLTADILISPN